MYKTQKEVEQSHDNRYKSFLIADELKQSSDDLTRYCRTYVLTGDSMWEKKYWEVLDVRNGVKPRPDGRVIALQDSMRKLGFTTIEFDKLKEAEKNSNALVWTEKIAFHAVKGYFDNGTGLFTNKDKPDTALARKIMFNKKYHDDKSTIMNPIEDFFKMVEHRTLIEVENQNRKVKKLLSIIIVLIILIAIIAIISYFTIKNKIIKQLNTLKQANKIITEGEKKLKVQNEQLDEKVEQKTAELKQQNKELQSITNKLKDVNQELATAKDFAEISETKFRDILDNSIITIYSLNLKTGTYDYLSPSVKDIYGYSSDEFIEGGLEKSITRFHPDDISRIEDHLNGLLDKKVEHFSPTVEYRFKHPKLGWRWMSDTRAVLVDNNNEAVSLIGFAFDNTENKLSLEKLQIQNEEYASLNEEYLTLNEELNQTNENLYETKENAEKSEKRFRHLFENNPVSLWEEDFSEVKELLIAKENHVKNLKHYLESNRDFVALCASKIIIKNINKASLNLFKVKNKSQLTEHLTYTFTETSFKTLKNLLVALSNNETDFVEETEYKNTDGEIIYAIIKVLSSADDSSSIVSIIDITQSKKAELELQKQNSEYEALAEEYKAQNKELYTAKKRAEKSEKQFAALFEQSPLSINIFDKSGLTVKANKAWEKLWQSDPNEVINKYNVLEDSHAEATGWLKYLRKAFNGEVVFLPDLEYDPTANNFPGRKRTLQCIAFPIIQNNTVEQIVLIHQDVTDLKDYEKKLIIAKENAEESDRLKTAFLNNMSHEIRTPMNAIVGFSKMLISPVKTQEQKNKYTDTIIKSSHQILNIINDLLDIASIEAGQIKIKEVAIDLSEICDDIINLLRPEAKKKNIDLKSSKHHLDITESVLTDNFRLKQILENLINNAIKFTNKGSVELKCHKKDKYIVFSVSDTGIGIPMNEQNKIFERFRQVESSEYDASEGNGLGLSICKGLIERMGGEIWLESEPGKGSTFYFSLPYNPANL